MVIELPQMTSSCGIQVNQITMDVYKIVLLCGLATATATDISLLTTHALPIGKQSVEN